MNHADLWIQEKNEKNEWKEVRAYDAIDLESWINFCLPVQVWFAEEIGLSDGTMQTIDQYWKNWSEQTDPIIDNKAFLHCWEVEKEALLKNLSDLETGNSRSKRDLKRISVIGSNLEETVAFICGSLLKDTDLQMQRYSATSIILESANSWKYIEQNPTLKTVVVTKPEFSQKKPNINRNITVITPFSKGNNPVLKAEDKVDDKEKEINLSFPSIYKFSEALEKLGFVYSEAQILARKTFQSWAAFREIRSTNPSLRAFSWLNFSETIDLVPLCLIYQWDQSNKNDQELISRVFKENYEDLEKNLLRLKKVDYNPINKEGEIWFVNSIWLFFHKYSGFLTRGAFERFFQEAESCLEGIKKQESMYPCNQAEGSLYSEQLLHSICNSLIILSFVGPQIDDLKHYELEKAVDLLVKDLLDKSERFILLLPYLDLLAEASPVIFLKSIKKNLSALKEEILKELEKYDRWSGTLSQILAQIRWPLEILAWFPQYFSETVEILWELSLINYHQYEKNIYFRTLCSIFRTWLPQTAASFDQRIEVLDKLINFHPNQGIDLLNELTPQTGSIDNAEPKWREYGIKEEIHNLNQKEFQQMSEFVETAKTKLKPLIDKKIRLFK